MTDDDTARTALARIGFPPEAVQATRLTRLPGLTNRVYKVELGGKSYALRIPGEGAAAIIDRRAEEAIARTAAAVGIAPDVLHFAEDGVMLTPFIEGATTLSAARFRADAGALVRAAQTLARLHAEGPDFPREFDAFGVAQNYVELLERRRAELPTPVPELMRSAGEMRLALAARPAALRPCHCDPTGANLLDTGTRIWLIDWEYAGMNNPMWDLAYLSVQGSFDPSQDQRLLTAYLGRRPGAQEMSRMAVHQALVELISALWALVQESGGNRAGDFHAYALATLEACSGRIWSGAFAEHLEVLRRG